MKKAISGIMLTLLLIGILTLAFNIQPIVSGNFVPLLWKYTTGGRVYAVCVSPNNEYILAGSDDRNVYCLDPATGQEIWNYSTGEWSDRVLISIYSVFISPDNKYAVAGTASNVYCFNITNGNKIWNYTVGEAWSVFVSPNNRYVIAGSFSGNIFCFDISNGTLKWSYPAGGYVFSVFVSPDGKYVLAGYSSGVIALDINGNFLWNYYTNGYIPQKSLFVSTDSRYVIAGSTGLGIDYGRGRIYALNITNGQQIWNYTATGTPLGGASNIPITSVFVSSDSKFVVAATGNGITPYLDISDGNLIWNYSTGSYMWDVCISPDSRYVVTGSVGQYPPLGPYVLPNVFCLDTTEGSRIWNYSTPATSISISPDSKTIIVGSWDHNVYAFYPYALPVVTATVNIAPETLNLISKGKWITAYIELPEGYDASDIDILSVRLNGEIPAELHPTEIGDYDEDGIPDLMVKFGRQDLIAILSVGEATLTITGEVNGISFEGSDTIRVIDQ